MMTIRSLSIALGLLLLVGDLHAETNDSATYVVIVGNNRSADEQIEDLQYADDDAALYYRLLQHFAVRTELVTQLDDASQRRHPDIAAATKPPNRANLLEALSSVYEQIRVDKRTRKQRTELIFIFIGHGGLDKEGKGYVHLADGRFTRADLFHEVISASPADFTHLIIDACNAFSLVAGRGEKGQETAHLDAMFQRFLTGHELEDYPSVGVLAATSENRETHEWSRIGSGVFSYQVRSALSGAADINNDGKLEYSEIAAFVDAANAELPSAGKRIATFAWPPERDRRAPVLDLAAGRGLRRVIVDRSVDGRLFLETESGERWAEFHAPNDQAVAIRVAAAEDCFLRDGKREIEIPAGTEDFWVRQPPNAAYAIASRGAVDRAFERGLFKIPFSKPYYHGYVGGRSQLVAVAFVSDELEAPPADLDLEIAAGYTLGGLAVASDEIEHGVFVRLELPIDAGLALAINVEGTHSWLQNGNNVSRASIIPGVSIRYQWGRLAVHGGLELGYAIIGLTGKHGGADYSVGVARGRLGIELQVAGAIWLLLGGTYSGYLVTLDGKDEVRGAPQASVGLAWR